MPERSTDGIQSLRRILKSAIDSTPERVSVYFKTGPGDYAQGDRFLGIRVPTLRKIAKNFLWLTLDDLALVILSPFNEERLLALIILTEQYKAGSWDHREDVYQFYLQNILYVNNWNLVDSSAHLIIGAHIFERVRDFNLLEKLAQSQNLWERRIAIVSTWYFIRKKDLDWTFKIAILLQDDSHDLIHKAVGWMLREAGKKDEGRLLSFLHDHASDMPRTMLRYAIERLSQDQKKLMMDVERNRKKNYSDFP